MIVTDLAARGLDIPLLNNVINYDWPSEIKLLVQRSGRTARAGKRGTAYSFLLPDELAYLVEAEKYIERKVIREKEFLEMNKEEQANALIDPQYVSLFWFNLSVSFRSNPSRNFRSESRRNSKDLQ